MAVAALVDTPAVLLLDALDAVRDQPAPLGQAPARLGVLARAAAELHGVYLRELAVADAAGEATAAGHRSLADLLVDTAGLPTRQARADAALARRLSALPGLLDALAGGGLELPAARQLARAWAVLPPALHDAPTVQALIALGGLVDLADLQGKVDELVAALQPEVTDDAVAAARGSGGLTLTDVGAETRLTAHTDVLTGEWLREVLSAKAEADRGLADGRTTDARLLDALLDIVRAAVHTPAVPGADGGAPQLVVVATPADLLRAVDADADAVDPAVALDGLLAPLRDGETHDQPGLGTNEEPGPRPAWSARTRGGTRLGPRTLLGVACTATLTRLLLSPLGHPLDSTPAARQLSRRERRALEHRADSRCERTGCGRPARACVPHHVVPWALGGPSTLANTVLLCRSCHHLLHDRQRELCLTGDRRIGPTGWTGGGPPGG